MKRIIDHYLLDWKNSQHRKSLLIRGARQIGKTYAVRQLGTTYQQFIEINFEERPDLISVFELNLTPERILKELSEKLSVTIDQTNCLLFFDEIQAAPQALLSLRYFYENMPQLHVIAAGSLIDFAIKLVGVPVGRVQELDMRPLSFLEFLWATGNTHLTDTIMEHAAQRPLDESSHQLALKLLGEYVAVGGMPEAVQRWTETKDITQCTAILSTIIKSYRQDFNKYTKKYQLKLVRLLFNQIPKSLGQKFKFNKISGEYRKSELAPCLDLLETARLVTPVVASAGQGIPLGSEVDFDDFKLIFLDIALSQVLLGLKGSTWINDPLKQFVNKGELVEAFVGQELLAYQHPAEIAELYYWHKETKELTAEIDYLVQSANITNTESVIIPLEVKSGAGTTLKSLHTFLEKHPRSPFGIRLSTQPYSVHEKIYSYPLYAIPAIMQQLWKK